MKNKHKNYKFGANQKKVYNTYRCVELTNESVMELIKICHGDKNKAAKIIQAIVTGNTDCLEE